MKSAVIIFFILSAIFLIGAGKFIVDLKRPGVYPPKQVLKERALALAGAGVIFFFIALMFSFFQ